MTRYAIEDFISRLREQNPWYRRGSGLPTADAPAYPVDGINVCGYLRDESGLGTAARGYIRALDALGIPVALTDLSALSSNRSEDTTLTAFAAEATHGVNLLCIDAGQHFAVMEHLGEEWLEGRYNIGVWAWELANFPPKWYDRLAYYDEIWVGTSFIADALAPISPIPIVRIPPVLTTRAEGSQEPGRRRLGVADGTFVFLFIFDFHSHLPRKNPLTLIDAFARAFAPSDPVRLVIKCVNGEADPTGFAALRARADGHSIDIHDGYWPAEEIRDLMAASDAYVSLHRSEGTGLTITEAMALGKPVIATGWSGNMDVMDVANSFPVRYDLVELPENIGPYGAGERWADPSVEHAAELMRLVFTDRDQAQVRALRAKRDIATRFSTGQVARLIRQRLDVIATRHRFPVLRREMRAFLAGYGQLTAQIRAIADTVLPPDAHVLVVSKGDNGLLELAGRRAAHFPQEPDGTYLGYYPADSAGAIEHLEVLRARGAGFLLLPGTAFWWLEHYAAFARHLDERYERIWDDERCAIYRLCGSSARAIHVSAERAEGAKADRRGTAPGGSRGQEGGAGQPNAGVAELAT